MASDSLFQLTPDRELIFKKPFTSVAKHDLKVANLSSKSCVAFKVKTTAPKQYCVRPNSGRLYPNQSVVVQVIMQPMREDPADDFKCKDKFLVQCMEIDESLMQLDSNEASSKLKDLWGEKEKNDKESGSAGSKSVHEIKLRVIFAHASYKAGDREATLSGSDSQESLRSTARTIASVNAPIASSSAEGTINLEAQPKTVTSSLTPNNPVTKPTITSHLAPSTLPPASTDVPSVLSTCTGGASERKATQTQDLRSTADSAVAAADSKLKLLELKLAEKQKELDILSSNLRQRNTGAASKSVTFDKKGSSKPFQDGPETVTITGIPAKLVLILVVLAFLFGVAFF